MQVRQTGLPGVVVIEPDIFADSRGSFMETYNLETYRTLGLPLNFVQDNIAVSVQGVLRGLHLQNPHGQGKLVYVLDGEVFDVAVDVRRGSPEFGRFVTTMLSGENKHQLYIPTGFAHGYCVLSKTALLAYKCTEYYDPDSEMTIAWNDPQIGIDWPIGSPQLSAKDEAGLTLSHMDPARLPVFDQGTAP